MTREEAIKKFEKQLHSAMVVLDSGFGTSPGECDRVYRERKEMAEIALSALRQQEHFREATKKVEPLTMDELRQMDGEPVWVQFLHNKIGYWDLIRWHNSEFIRSYRSVFLLIDEYGKTWLAYRHKPEEGAV